MIVSITVAIVSLAIFAIFRLYSITSALTVNFSSDDYLNNHLKYQLALLILAGLVLILTYAQNPQNLSLLLSIGNLSAPAEPVEWFGIQPNTSWVFVGLYLSAVITLGTATFVYLQFRGLNIPLSKALPYTGWILLFSLTNSFSEEAIFRLGIVSPMLGTLDVTYIALISASLFGVAHFRGMPHGLVGMVMAGFLGWLLAKSVIETQGIFWAWFIHFIQDVVIYIGFMLNRVKSKQQERLVTYG